MIEWLNQHFLPGRNYLVAQDQKEQINSFISNYLVAPFQAGRKHNLWGKIAEKLPLMGKKLGWVPNKIPAIFLTQTVEQEVADALAATDNSLFPTANHLKISQNLLSRFNLQYLTQKNPLFLSEGETKILWFITQWVKKTNYFIVGYLPSTLSPIRTKELASFLLNNTNSLNTSKTIILGYLRDQTDWCAELISHQQWQLVSNWPAY